ncbi:MAG TPA: putative glycoside hydrolase [Solirubrobacteraceae bacterium]
MNPVRRLTAVPIVLAALLVPALAPQLSRAAVASHLTLALSSPARLGPLRAVARRSAYVVLQPWESRVARVLKRDNPHLEVLAYQNFGSISVSAAADGLSSSGVPYAQAAGAHSGWFLTTPTGTRIQENGYPYLLMADVGNRGYQRRWTADVVHLLRHGPWDGVFMDDVNASPRPEAGSATIARYPTDAAYQAAVGSMLRYAGPRIRASGKLAIANIGEWVDHPAVARLWLHDLDGGMDEKFVKWSVTPGVGYRDAQQWLSQEREVLATQAMGKRFLAVTAAAPSDTRAQLYGWASLLLVSRGRASYLAAETYDGAARWISAYRARLGRPLGAMKAGPHGIYRRSFARGLVLVNPTTSAVRVSLGGRFSGSGLHNARITTLGPHRALVLVGARGPAPTHRWPIVILVIVALLVLALWRRRRPPAVRGGAQRRSDARAARSGPRAGRQGPPTATPRPRRKAFRAASPPAN